MSISKFKIGFDHNKKTIFSIPEFDKFSEVKINSSINMRRNSHITVFNSIVRVSIPNNLCIDYIDPVTWYINLKEQIKKYIVDNLDASKYTFTISDSDTTSTQDLLKKDFYYMNLYISFSITDIELKKDLDQKKLERLKR